MKMPEDDYDDRIHDPVEEEETESFDDAVNRALAERALELRKKQNA